MDNEGLITRLRKRAEIRRSIPRGEPDRISDILEESADMLESLRDPNERSNVSIPIDCCQCEQFVCERMACAATLSCVNGSQYEPSGFVQLYRKD
jgi:hypothetical protein